MKQILILGAGFGGLELATSLSEALTAAPDPRAADITLVDAADDFVFGYSKLDVMFGLAPRDAVRLPYRAFVKPGVRLVKETVLAIDPAARRVTTDAGTREADVLVIALGADYDVSGTPGVVLGHNEFYSLAGASALRERLPAFTSGDVVIGVCWAPFKCPPAPSECALMLHDHLARRGVRGACSITLVMPLSSPVPPSPPTAAALLAAFAERGITFIAGRRVVSVDEAARAVTLDDGRTLPCDLFLGVPRNRAPDVVVATGMTKDGWVEIDPRTLETRHPDVYALGDLANTGAPKAGIFAEGAARTVAANILARLHGDDARARNPGTGQCYIEFGGGRIARVDVDFFSGPAPVGVYHAPSLELRAAKEEFGRARRRRWFGLP